MNLKPFASCLAAAVCGLGLWSLSAVAARAETVAPSGARAVYLNPIVVVEGGERRFYRDDYAYRHHPRYRRYEHRHYRSDRHYYNRDGRRIVVERRVY